MAHLRSTTETTPDVRTPGEDRGADAASEHPRRARSWLLALRIIAPLLAFIALAAWGLSSPVGSSPDDDFHLPSIWCGLGERAGLCEPSGDADTRLVPAALVGEPCYARDAAESAACWTADGALIETDRVNVGPLYPPLFYGAMSVFASPDVVTSVLAMRLFNAALFTGLVTAAAFAVPVSLRRSALLPFIVTMVPLGMFVVPSTNASSWALLSAGVLWITLYAATRATGARQWTLLALAALAGLLGAGARADAAAFAVLAVVVVVILTARRDARLVPVFVVAAAIVVMSAAFYLSAGQSSAVTEGLPTDEASLSGWQLVENFLGVPSLWVGIFGGWGLGWLDTPLPAAVSVLGFAVFAMAAAIGIRRVTLRKAIATGILFAAFWLVPFVLLWQSRALIGTYVQPRYILPLATMLIGVALLRRSSARPMALSLVVTGTAMLVFTNAVALHVELNRYTTGLDLRTVIPGKDAEWSWATGPSAAAVWAVGAIAFAATLVSLYAHSVIESRTAIAAADPADAPRASV